MTATITDPPLRMIPLSQPLRDETRWSSKLKSLASRCILSALTSQLKHVFFPLLVGPVRGRSQNIATANHITPQPGSPAPFHQVNALNGLATVAFDIYSFYPFGESTLDVVHTSWAYHDGVPRRTLLEINRVLRPGGFFVIRQIGGKDDGAHPPLRIATWVAPALHPRHQNVLGGKQDCSLPDALGQLLRAVAWPT